MEPAKNIISALGGPTAVARHLGLHRTRVSKWQAQKSVGGTGGVIPLRHIPKLIELGRVSGVHLSADDFLPIGEASSDAA